jgi:hypothetical protein
MPASNPGPRRWQDALYDPPPYKRNMDPASCRERFRGALLGPG